jgi:hypothetical protein
LLGFPALINLYSESIRLSPPIHQGRFAYRTTFQGRNPDRIEADGTDSSNSPTHPTNPDQSSQSSQFGRPSRQKRLCPCESGLNDGYHKFDKCAYVNPSVRPPNWKPNPAAEERFQNAYKSFTFRNAYKRAIARHQSNSTDLTNPPAAKSDKESTRAAFGTYVPKQKLSSLLQANRVYNSMLRVAD